MNPNTHDGENVAPAKLLAIDHRFWYPQRLSDEAWHPKRRKVAPDQSTLKYSNIPYHTFMTDMYSLGNVIFLRSPEQMAVQEQ